MSDDVPKKLRVGDDEAGKWVTHLLVTADGVDITDICTGFDVEKGEATVYVLSKTGRPMIVGTANDRHLLEATVSATIEVRRK